MQITVSGKQIDIGEAFQGYAEGHVSEIAEKYLDDNGLDASVTASRAPHGVRVDISVHARRGVAVQSHGVGDTAHLAFDAALERIAKRLRRHKRRLKDHHRRDKAEAMDGALGAQRYVIQASETTSEEPDESEAAGDYPAVVAEMRTDIDTMSVSEAVMRLDLADSDAIMFRNGGNGRLNVVYRRQDGNIGWIDPHTDADAGDSAKV